MADDQYADVAIMATFEKKVSSIYEETLTEIRANKKASQLKSNTLKTDTLNIDTNPSKCPSMMAYGTPCHSREPKAKR